jgi:hypothetical protein
MRYVESDVKGFFKRALRPISPASRSLEYSFWHGSKVLLLAAPVMIRREAVCWMVREKDDSFYLISGSKHTREEWMSVLTYHQIFGLWLDTFNFFSQRSASHRFEVFVRRDNYLNHIQSCGIFFGLLPACTMPGATFRSGHEMKDALQR